MHLFEKKARIVSLLVEKKKMYIKIMDVNF